jgi:NAD(P)-dependent dehydrogenase (short-subunit alcohol dehydrogenase family)
VIDVLYNNAGRLHFCGVNEVTEELWDQIHDVNVKYPFF